MERTEGPKFQQLALAALLSLLPAQAVCEEPEAPPSAAFSGLSALPSEDQSRAFDNAAQLPRDFRDAVAVPAAAWRNPASLPAPKAPATRETGPESSPFAGLGAPIRQALFAKLRAEDREALLQAARNALSEAGEPALELDAADARLLRLASAFAAGSGPGTTQEAFFEGLRLRSPHLAYYLARRGKYQVLLLKALAEDAVPEGTRFSPWELALDGGPETAVEWSSEVENGATFRGLRRHFSNGTVLFEGTSADQAFLSAEDPAGNRVMRAWLRRDAEGRVIESRETLLRKDTGRKIREAIEKTAQALSKVTSFADDGAVAVIETLDARTGTRTVEDRAAGVSVRVDTVKDPETGKTAKKASVTALKPNGSWKSQQGLVDKDGGIQVSRKVLPDGTVVDFLSRDLLRLTGADGKLLGHEARLDALLAATGEERAKLASELSRSLVAALKMDDSGGRRSTPLARWLGDMFSKDQFSSARLSVDAQGSFTLTYDKTSGGGRVEKAAFGTSSEFGKKRGDALILMTPISLDASGKGQVDPRRWREYLSDGSLLRWHSLIETKPATFWSNAKAITHVQLIKEEYRSGRWQETGREKKASLVSEAAATSTLGAVSEAIHETWGVGHVLKAGEVTAKTLYTGLVSAGNMGLWGLTGKEAFHLEASGGYASNPAMRALLDDQGFLDRLSAGERAEVERKARENRAAALAQAGFSRERTDPAVYAEMLDAPYASDELMGALQNYGAGSYGRRILDKAAVSTGASKVALTAAGSVVRVTENVAETLLNPVIWATFGVGRGVAALKALSAAGIGARFLPASLVPTALVGAQAAEMALAGILYGSWAVGGIHNAAQTVQAFREDSDHSDKWLKASDAATDLFFLGMMAKDAWDANRAQKALKALDARQADFARQAQAASIAIEAKQTKTAAPQAKGTMQVQSLIAEIPQAPKAAPLAKALPKEKLLAPKRGLMDRMSTLRERLLSRKENLSKPAARPIRDAAVLDRIPLKTRPSPRVWGGGQDLDKDAEGPPRWKLEDPDPVSPEKDTQPIFEKPKVDPAPVDETPHDKIVRKTPPPIYPGIHPEPPAETPVEPPPAPPQAPPVPVTLEDPVAEPWMRDTGDGGKGPEGQEDGKQGGKSGGSSGKSSSGGGGGGGGGGIASPSGSSNGSGQNSQQDADHTASPSNRDAAIKSGADRPFDGGPKAAALTPSQAPRPSAAPAPTPDPPQAAPAEPKPAAPARAPVKSSPQPVVKTAPPFHYFYGKAGEVAGLGAFSPRPPAAPAAEAQAQPIPDKAPAPALPMPEKKLSAPASLEEYQDPKTTNFLPPARHLDTGRLPEKNEKNDKGDGLFYLLQFAALGAGIFLLRYSELPFLLGFVRKPY